MQFFSVLQEQVDEKVNKGSQSGRNGDRKYPGPDQVNCNPPAHRGNPLGKAYPDDRPGDGMGC